MIYKLEQYANDHYLKGGENLVDAAKNDDQITTDSPKLFAVFVTIGKEKFASISENPVDANKGAKSLFEMQRRVDMDDAEMRIRQTDDGEFVEFVSPSLGYAVKAVSKYNREPVEYYIGAGTPWVRWNKEEQLQEVSFDEDAFVDTSGTRKDEMAELGFTEPNVWYKAERVKIKTSFSDKKKWVWKNLE